MRQENKILREKVEQLHDNVVQFNVNPVYNTGRNANNTKQVVEDVEDVHTFQDEDLMPPPPPAYNETEDNKDTPPPSYHED